MLRDICDLRSRTSKVWSMNSASKYGNCDITKVWSMNSASKYRYCDITKVWSMNSASKYGSTATSQKCGV